MANVTQPDPFVGADTNTRQLYGKLLNELKRLDRSKNDREFLGWARQAYELSD